MVLRASIIGLTLTAAFGTTVAFAQDDSVFSSLAGSWSGSGTIAMNDGPSERIRCRAHYDVTPSGIIMHQNLRCASDSYKFDIESTLQAEGSTLTGTWTETSRQVTGDVTGTINGGNIATIVNATGFAATLNVQTHRNDQVVSIVPRGTDIQAVKVTMKRA